MGTPGGGPSSSSSAPPLTGSAGAVVSRTCLTWLRSQAASLSPIAQREKSAVLPSMTKSGESVSAPELGPGLESSLWLFSAASCGRSPLAELSPRDCKNQYYDFLSRSASLLLTLQLNGFRGCENSCRQTNTLPHGEERGKRVVPADRRATSHDTCVHARSA